MSRRDALRYATAASVLAGLSAATGARAPAAAAAAPTLIDFAMRQIPAAGYPGRRPLRGDQLRLDVASRLVLRRQADHPALRAGADRSWASDRQQLPVRQARRDSAVGLHPRVRRGRRRRSHRMAAAHRRRWRPECTGLLQRRRRHRPRDVEHRCAAVVSRNQFGDRSAAHRDLRGHQGVPVGCGRWCHREVAFARPRVGLADPVLVQRSDLSRRRSLPARGEHRVESRARWSVGSKSTSATSWPRIAASGTSIHEVVTHQAVSS